MNGSGRAPSCYYLSWGIDNKNIADEQHFYMTIKPEHSSTQFLTALEGKTKTAQSKTCLLLERVGILWRNEFCYSCHQTHWECIGSTLMP